MPQTCNKHRGHELERNGTCSRCEDPAQALLRLKAAVKPKLRTPAAKKPGAWWMGKLKQYARENRPVAGQDAALPNGDRE
jgi:hypothetical protein